MRIIIIIINNNNNNNNTILLVLKSINAYRNMRFVNFLQEDKCGSRTHFARNCSSRNREDQPQRKKFRVRRDLGESDVEDINWIEEVNGVIETYRNSDHVYVDTCASAGLFILSDTIYFSYIAKINGVIGLTAARAAITKGTVGCWKK